jgi:hypothetical protein
MESVVLSPQIGGIWPFQSRPVTVNISRPPFRSPKKAAMPRRIGIRITVLAILAIIKFTSWYPDRKKAKSA